MSSDPPPVLPGSSRHRRPTWESSCATLVRRSLAGSAPVSLRRASTTSGPAHTAVFQHIEADGSRLTDLAERAQITKQSMGYLVDYLEERDYLERHADPSDRRATIICLTDRGWAESPCRPRDN